MECWKPIEGYCGLYEVSNTGKIKAITKSIDSGKCHRKWKEHIMCTAEDKKGYLRTVLSKQGVSKTVKVHRLVAQAFIPNPLNLPQINHKDGNKQNNAVENLEWCDQSTNMKEACRTGLIVRKGENNSQHKLTHKDVEWIRNHYVARDCSFGSAAMATRFGVHRKTIGRIVKNKCWKGGDSDVKRSKAVSASN